MNPMTPPPGYLIVLTEDGSITLHSDRFDENCHSTTGAMTETKVHYFEGCQIQERAKQFNPFTILEIGFGLGVGLIYTFEKLKSENHIHFISMELDTHLIEWVIQNYSQHPLLSRLLKNGHHYVAEYKNFKLTILIGDARQTLPPNNLEVHAIYQDAFSPKKNSTLWTREWFTQLKNISHPDCIMSTYSSSVSIRKSMLEAGWKIQNGSAFGPKKSSTRAYLNQESDVTILEHLKRSPITALTDENLNDKNK